MLSNTSGRASFRLWSPYWAGRLTPQLRCDHSWSTGIRRPILPHFVVALLDGSPGDTVCDLLAAMGLASAVGAPGIVEGLSEDILGVLWQVASHSCGQIVI